MGLTIGNEGHEKEEDEDSPLLKGSSGEPPFRLITVEPLVVFFTASLGILSYIMPLYIEERLAEDRNFTLTADDNINGTCSSMNESDPNYITRQEIAADLSTWQMVNSAFMFLPAIFVTPFYGALSDRLGRKAHLAFPVVSHTLVSVLIMLVLYFRLPLAVLSFAHFLLGLGGNINFFMAGCLAYITDVSTKRARLVRLAVLQTVYFGSAGLIQLPSACIIESYGFVAVYWLSIALQTAAIIYLILPNVLIETVRKKITNKISPKNLLLDFKELFLVNERKRKNRLLIILVLYFLADIFQLSSSATLLYGIYGLGPPFCWSAVTFAYFGAVFLLFSAIGLLIGTKVFSLCLQEFWILQIAFTFGCLSNIMLALAPTTALFFLGAIFGSLRGMDGPVLNTILSKMVSPQERGTVFAVESCVQSIANFISPLVLNSIYSATVKTYPSLVFFVIGGMFLLLLVLSWIWLFYSKRVSADLQIERKLDSSDIGLSADQR